MEQVWLPQPYKQLVTCPLLEEHDLVQNVKYGFLACRVHGWAFEGIPISHLLKQHRITITDEKKVQLNAFVSAQQEPNSNIQILMNGQTQSEHVEGLTIFKGWKCGECGNTPFISKTKRIIKNHCREVKLT